MLQRGDDGASPCGNAVCIGAQKNVESLDGSSRLGWNWRLDGFEWDAREKGLDGLRAGPDGYEANGSPLRDELPGSFRHPVELPAGMRGSEAADYKRSRCNRQGGPGLLARQQGIRQVRACGEVPA